MTDREKVMAGIEHCLNYDDCRGCVYFDDIVEWGRNGYRCDCMVDAFTLLKEQEPVKPIWINTNYEQSCKCGNCGGLANTHFKYCPYCGRSLRWGNEIPGI